MCAEWMVDVDEHYNSDIRYMQLAIEEAEAALARGDIPIGAVVVRSGSVIGRGSNRRSTGGMPFSHAEMFAIAEAMASVGSDRLDGCSLYSTLEPCVMCAGAIISARIAVIVYGAKDPRAGACGSLYDIPGDPRMPHRCRIRSGIMADRCASMIQLYFRSRRK